MLTVIYTKEVVGKLKGFLSSETIAYLDADTEDEKPVSTGRVLLRMVFLFLLKDFTNQFHV